jgi:hypothetical protein
MPWSSYDLWKSDIGAWPSIDDDDRGVLLRRSPWFRPRLPAVPDERVCDVTDGPVVVPERSTEVLDLTDTVPPGGDVLDLTDPAPVVVDLTEDPVPESPSPLHCSAAVASSEHSSPDVLDLTEPEDVCDLAELLAADVGTLNDTSPLASGSCLSATVLKHWT